MKLIIDVNANNSTHVRNALGYGGFIGCEKYTDMCTCVLDSDDFEDIPYDELIEDVASVMKALIPAHIKFTVEYE